MKQRSKIALALAACGLAALWCSTPASAAVDPAMVAARQKFFGAENVDANTGAIKKDKVIFSWATNATYAVSIEGRVVLLDTYIHRVELPPSGNDTRRSPLSPQDMVALHPEAIFLGHGHGDHADNAAYIAKLLNIPIYSSPETCDAMQADVVRMFNDPNVVNGGVKIVPDANPVTCVPVVSRGSVPGAEVVHLTQLEPLACIIAFKHIHSGSAPVDPSFPHVTVNNIADQREPQMYPTLTQLSPPTNPPVPGQMDLRANDTAGGPISLFYQFVLRGGYNFTFVWHNTTGPLKEGIGSDPGLSPSPGTPASAAVGAHLFSIMDALPPTDVEIGSVVSLGETNNGERDVIMYNQHLKPQIYIPIHMTNVALPSSSPEYRIAWLQQNDAMGVPRNQRPEIRWQVDPLDFLKPQVYSIGDPRWSNPNKASRVAQACN